MSSRRIYRDVEKLPVSRVSDRISYAGFQRSYLLLIGWAFSRMADRRGCMAQIEMEDIVEYQRFRRNPGPLLDRAAEGRPLLLLKGRKRLVVLDMAAYNQLTQQAGQATSIEGQTNVVNGGTMGEEAGE
jgi:hypothetical protein